MSDWVNKNPNFYTNGNKNYGLRYNKKTGDFQIYDTNTTEVSYQNGSWTSSALGDSNLFKYSETDVDKKIPLIQPKAEELNKQAREEILAGYRGLGGKAAGLPLNSAANDVNGKSGVTNITQTQVGVSTSVSTTNESGIAPLDNFPTIPLPEKGRVLKYPIDLISEEQDIFVITQFEYQSANKDIFSPGGQGAADIIQNGLIRNSILKSAALGQITLPMPNQVLDANSVQWASDNMDSVTAAATSLIGSNVGTAIGADLVATIAGKVMNNDMVRSLPRMGVLATLAANAAGGGPESNAALKAAIQSFVLNRFGFDIPPESILARGFGVVPNSNIQLLFQNVKLRDFTFKYKMSPRSEEEAKTINYILRWFKQGMAAKKRTLQAGGGALLLGTPNVFKLEYKSGGAPIKGVNKFKLCALSNFSVDYTSGGQWAAYDKGQPVAVSMSMTFNEIEPIYDTDYQDTENNIDTPPVKEDEVGF
jgi:hypothetical protein